MGFKSLISVASFSKRKEPLLLECLLCKDKFPTTAVEEKKYFLSTNICLACYKKGQLAKPQVWCFGKLQKRSSPGYAVENDSCKSLCPDREICKSFLTKQLKEKHNG